LCYNEAGVSKMSVTIKDIARIAKVSHTTVSRALNDSPLINDKTKNRIRKIAEELNYSPNVNAKSLVTLRSYNIGLFFSTLSTGTSAFFFYDVVRGVNREIGHAYNLVVKGIDDLKEQFNRISPRNFDGIIVMSQSGDDLPMIRHIINRGIPAVMLNREADGLPIVSILSDERAGVHRLIDYMIRNGHRRIGLIEGKPGFQSTIRRKRGFLDAHADHGIAPDPDLQVIGQYDVESGYAGMKRLLEHPEPPTAVFCSNDEMAVGAIKAAFEKGLRVPDDISVAGFDDSVFAAYTTPALTTVRRPIEEISRKGASVLLKMIGENLKNGRTDSGFDPIYMPAELVVRESVAEIANYDGAN